MNEDPGWQRLRRHSYRLGWRWLLSGARHGWRGARVGLCRLLVPLDPWRFYELGRAAEEDFDGDCLDVASPKLLPSLLHHEGRGRWLGIDLYRAEIERWRRVDPHLPLAVADATDLPYDDASFDHAICISVVEHLAGDGDGRAMAELWRVLKPGGRLILTTNVARTPRTLWRRDRIWGEASTEVDGKVFYERHYAPGELDERLLRQPWRLLRQEYARERDPTIHDRFVRRMPFSFLYGGLLHRTCPQNFVTGGTPDVLPQERHGVVYLVLGR